MLYTFILVLHIAAGFTALLSGGFSFTAPKGKKFHNTAGKIYTLAMIGVGSTAIVMCLMKYNPFLFTIGIFSTYMTLTGYRSLQYHKAENKPVLIPDWILLISALILAAAFTSYLIMQEGLHLQGLQPVLLVFMGILLSMLLGDARMLRSFDKQKKADLLRRHISRMGGAYISTVTAFLVTNIHTEPVYIAWLLPTAIGTPFIAYFIRKFTYKRKTNRQTTKARANQNTLNEKS
ncbi:DUF2306 domain-containing protein [Cesiribacter sp. SM1]|uniref:DUF2306 domain-containing protein n=1 Tax=Cesiribacter sp. SM1 TaxID=2861196 RepID=UPI001CD5F544|nr:DUF2306 domain-containing protein [Cesiribacter sp. SM1]